MVCNHKLSISTVGALKGSLQDLILNANSTEITHINKYLTFDSTWTNDDYNIWKTKSHVIFNDEWWNDLKAKLHTLTLDDNICVFHVKPSVQCSHAHFDTIMKDGLLTKVEFGLNFVEHSNQSSMIFFDRPDDQFVNIKSPPSYFNIQHESLVEIDRTIIDDSTLTLVNIGKYHDIVDVQEDRWAISIRAIENLSWEQVEIELSQWFQH